MTSVLSHANRVRTPPTTGRAVPDPIDTMPPDELYRCLLEQGPPFYLADLEGRVRFASASFRQLALDLAERYAADLTTLLAPAQIAAEVGRSGSDEPNESDLVIPGTPRRHFAVRHRAVRDTGGRLIGICGSLEDISEGTELLRELAMSQERLEDVTRLVSDWVWETDAALLLSSVSPRVVEMLDYHPRELIRRRFTDIGSFPDGELPFAAEGTMHSPFRDVAFRIERRDGDRRLLRLSGLPVFSATTGQFVGYRGTARDVTQETEAAERLAQSRGQLFAAIENISEGFALYDGNESLVLCNGKYRSMFPATAPLLDPGIAFADFFRATIARGGVVLDDDETAEGWCERQRALRREGPVSFELQLGDGRWVKVGDRRTADGSIVSILTDITELKRREQALSAAKELAEIASQSKSEFLANVSHELRTPLNAIIGFTEIMRDEIFGPVGSVQYRDYLGDIVSSAHHLLDVINDILDVARAEARRLDLDGREVEVGALIRAAARLVQERAQRAELTVTIAGGGVPPVIADEQKLKQVLHNLLTNAIKFTPPGGRIGIAARLDAVSGDLLIEVTDTGIGIAPGDIATALAPFGQVDGTLSRKYDGAGLGLPLARAMVELHGGSLAIHSRVGEGTKVTVRLPAARLHTGAVLAPVPAPG